MTTWAAPVGAAFAVAPVAAGLGFVAAAVSGLADRQSLGLVDSRCSVGSVAET